MIINSPTLYIDGLPRPKEPWHETLCKLVPELILEPFKTYEIHDEMYHEDWLRIVESLVNIWSRPHAAKRESMSQ